MSDPTPDLPVDLDGRPGGVRRARAPRPTVDPLPPRSTISRLRAWLTIARVIGVVASIAGPGIVGYTLVRVVFDDREASTLVREAVSDGLRQEAEQRGGQIRDRAAGVRSAWASCGPDCELGDRLVAAWDQLVTAAP